MTSSLSAGGSAAHSSQVAAPQQPLNNSTPRPLPSRSAGEKLRQDTVDQLQLQLGSSGATTTFDNDLALRIYIKARAKPKLVVAFAERREFDKILIYLKQVNMSREATAFLLDVLKPNLPEHAFLRTKLLMLSCQMACSVTMAGLALHNYVRKLVFMCEHFSFHRDKSNDFPNVADAILANGMFNHYDRPCIAQLCEKAGLYVRALQV
ncbi:hypothetical protein OROHE_002696 [Orobanche hederae]